MGILNDKRQRQQADNSDKQESIQPPTSPAPEPEPWPEPIPLDQAEPPPAFPLGIFTDTVRRVIDTVTRDTRAAVDYASGAVISTSASAIGGTCRAVGKGRWSEQPSLWIPFIGLPSEKKTPSASIILAPLFAANERRMRIARKRDEQAKKDSSVTGTCDAGEPRIYDNDEGVILIQTCTVEGLIRAYQRQRRGILYTRSELTGWLDGLNQYKAGKGDDRQTFIELYDGKSLSKLLSNEHIYCPNVCNNIFGGFQPALVEKFVGVSDGMDARMLPIYPAPRVATEEDWFTADPFLLAQWKAIVDRLLSLSMDVELTNEGEYKHIPTYYHMDDEARERWVSYTRWAAAIQNDPETSPKIKDWIGKHEGFGLRLAITLRMLAEADPVGDVATRPANTITALDIDRTTTLMDYFHRMCRRMYGVFTSSEEDDLAKRVLLWIRTHKVSAFTRNECWKSSLCSLVKSSNALIGPFAKLREYCYIRPKIEIGAKGRGRPSEEWEVHPKLLQS